MSNEGAQGNVDKKDTELKGLYANSIVVYDRNNACRVVNTCNLKVAFAKKSRLKEIPKDWTKLLEQMAERYGYLLDALMDKQYSTRLELVFVRSERFLLMKGKG